MANISAIKLPSGNTYNLVDKTSGYVTADAIPTKTSDLTNDSDFITGMTILSYGGSTWQNFIDAYNANKVVYCRASSGSNPASGSQTRLAFMAYVNNATTPTEVEFQYYRSVSTHTASQQGDQVYVYKLNKTNGWSVTVREASVKVVAGTGLGGTYSNGTMTLTGPTKVSDLTNDSGFVTTDENVTSTVGGTGTFYLTGSSSSSTTTGGLNKNANASITISPDQAQLTLGGSSAPGKSGYIKLYDLNGGYKTTISTVLTLTADRTLTLPDISGTIHVGTSGVTAGTYDGGATKGGFYVPSITVDENGHVTSATDLGNLIGMASSDWNSYPGLVTGYQYRAHIRNAASYANNFVLQTGQTTVTFTLNDAYGGHEFPSIQDVQCYDASTKEPVIVDWYVSSLGGKATTFTLTVSIAEVYSHDIYIFPSITYRTVNTM